MNTTSHLGLRPTRAVLPNGAVVIALETATHPAVTVLAGVDAGSGYDPADRLGLAHLLSHVIDRGTTTRSEAELAEFLDDRGVALESGVSRHVLRMSSTCLSRDFDAVLAVMIDVLCHPTFPEAQVARRRHEVVTAIREDQDSPAVVASEALMALLYPGGHPYGRPAKGSVESVSAVERDHLLDFHAAHVAPDRLRLVIVGDVASARAIELAGRALEGWRPVSTPRLQPALVTAPAGRRRVDRVLADKAQTDIAYGFATIRRDDPRYFPMVVMNNVLGEYGMGGRLGDAIRERQGMAYYAFSSFDANVGPGPLVVRAGVSPDNVERTLASIDDEVYRMSSQGVSTRELADAKRYLIGSIPRVLETNGEIAGFLHRAEFFGLGLDYDRRLPGLLDAVSRDEVVAVARSFLERDRAAIAVAGPMPDYQSS